MSCFFKQLFFLTLLTIVVQTRAAPLFDDNSVLDIEVIGPLGSLFASKKDRQEAPFILRANGADHDVKLRVRGKSRVRVCDFLPLRVNYSNDDTSESIFEGQDKLKLVSQCKKSKRSRLDTLEEFAAYRIFNLISEVSYKVRLLRVTYTDTDERINDKFVEQYGFLIESDVGLAERLGVESVESPGVTLRLLDENQAAAVFIFQYLIGNTDWSLVTADDDDTCCHNGDIFSLNDRLYLVPYDFDLAGVVNARYAYPDPSLRIRKVTQRRYRGYCTSPQALQTALRNIKSRKTEILGVFDEIPGLSPKDIDANVEFLGQFFANAEDEQKLLRRFSKRCL